MAANFPPLQNGHAPITLHHLFRDAVAEFEDWAPFDPEPRLEFDGHQTLISSVFDAMRECTDIVPANVVAGVKIRLTKPWAGQGSLAEVTFSTAARIMGLLVRKKRLEEHRLLECGAIFPVIIKPIQAHKNCGGRLRGTGGTGNYLFSRRPQMNEQYLAGEKCVGWQAPAIVYQPIRLRAKQDLAVLARGERRIDCFGNLIKCEYGLYRQFPLAACHQFQKFTNQTYPLLGRHVGADFRSPKAFDGYLFEDDVAGSDPHGFTRHAAKGNQETTFPQETNKVPACLTADGIHGRANRGITNDTQDFVLPSF